jgi:hypothetical protein
VNTIASRPAGVLTDFFAIVDFGESAAEGTLATGDPGGDPGSEAASASRSSEELRMTFSAVLMACLLAAAPASQVQPTPPEPPQPPATATASAESSNGELPVSLARIQRALASPPSIRIVEGPSRNGRPLYRVDVEADKIDIHALLGTADLTRGAVPYGGMTHQEFLDMVTPNDVRGYAPFSNGEGMMIAATSIALQWAVLKAVDKLKRAADERAKSAARAEVEEALEALQRARRAAGLPEK